MILFKVDAGLWEVRKVDGEPWPGRDSEGDECYENTHFENEETAWQELRSEAAAYVQLSGRGVTRAKESLAKAVEDAANAAEAMSKVDDMIHKRASTPATPKSNDR